MTTVELGHLTIATAYVLLAVASGFINFQGVANVVQSNTLRRDTWMCRIGGVLFFLGCAAHHMEMLSHIATVSPLDGYDFHHALPTLTQVIGAPMFLFGLWPYIRVFFGAFGRIGLERDDR
jgi:hypothetical protein